MKTAIEVQQLSVHYDRAAILWDISFSASKGSLLGIIGPNGAGKSTLIKALVGLVRPASGRIHFGGRDLDANLRRQIAYVPQRSAVDWDFPISVFDLALMGRYRQRGMLRWLTKEDRLLAQGALQKVGLWDLRDRQIGQLSGGQQQRAFLARALVQGAELYFLDEPFAGVDMATESELIKILRALRDEGKTLLCVHHDLLTVRQIFDTVLVLNTSLIACGPVAQVLQRETLAKAYGKSSALFDEMMQRSQTLQEGWI